jgi:hypothetical protein
MNLAQLRTYVLDRLSIDSTDTAKVTQIDRQLNTEYLRVVAEERLNVTKTTLALVADSQVVDLPDDWTETLALQRGATVMIPASFEKFAALDAAGTNSGYDAPIFYYQESPDRLRVFPTPTTTDPDGLTLWYCARPDAMTVDANTPVQIPDEYHDMLAELVVHRIAMSEEAFDLAQSAKQIADELRGRLIGQMRKRQGPGPRRLRLAVYHGPGL